jgi:hypothetical protein
VHNWDVVVFRIFAAQLCAARDNFVTEGVRGCQQILWRVAAALTAKKEGAPEEVVPERLP